MKWIWLGKQNEFSTMWVLILLWPFGPWFSSREWKKKLNIFVFDIKILMLNVVSSILLVLLKGVENKFSDVDR
jgi:hypothetical protein